MEHREVLLTKRASRLAWAGAGSLKIAASRAARAVGVVARPHTTALQSSFVGIKRLEVVPVGLLRYPRANLLGVRFAEVIHRRVWGVGALREMAHRLADEASTISAVHGGKQMSGGEGKNTGGSRSFRARRGGAWNPANLMRGRGRLADSHIKHLHYNTGRTGAGDAQLSWLTGNTCGTGGRSRPRGRCLPTARRL